MSGSTLVEVEDLSKHFRVTGGPLGVRTAGHVRAVDGVSFRIGAGETLALVGESGCGKTTISRLMLRLETPTTGAITLAGRDVHRLDRAGVRWFRRKVQAVFQDPWASLSPRMRVGDIIAEPLVVNERLSRTRVRLRVADMMGLVGLQPWQARLFPHEFSGGQRQRIALASALITEPDLVVLDEPVSALDVSVQAQVMNLLKDIQRERGTSFLLISHDLASVRYIAHQVAVMYLGEIVEQATADEIYERPRHPYTRALFDAILPAHPDDRRPGSDAADEVPSPLNPPSGCRFRTRCPHATDVCGHAPPRTALPGGGSVACHLYPATAGSTKGPVRQ
ncbi:ABC transporter ATP-binding protein [Phytohabitans suffuscus]|uniref:ABC transporter ATP-binding protein n=1 Tax=Phytohabitans suffuscus TaxID=624315 RepID=A0A6F8Z0L5_9ACTN|nr:oligopeptide/dipeptide ABC transporter ATP-binding protein [Phytohabitans suffuscus]BCB91864.1 ABC transporter ATP-binding protein [Phytohabitans suffuscus]